MKKYKAIYFERYNYKAMQCIIKGKTRIDVIRTFERSKPFCLLVSVREQG
jgi:hypothetical protein